MFQHKGLAGVIVAGACLTAQPASATEWDATGVFGLVTLGVGTGVSVTQATGSHDPVSTVATELSFRLRLFWALGLEFSYSPTAQGPDAEGLVFDSKYRLSGILYPIPTPWFGLYLKAGVGALEMEDFPTLSGETTSYHAGAGLEIYIGDHVAVAGEFLVLLPGAHAIESLVVDRALSSVVDSTTGGGGGLDPTQLIEDIEIGTFLSHNNYRAGVSLKYYF